MINYARDIVEYFIIYMYFNNLYFLIDFTSESQAPSLLSIQSHPHKSLTPMPPPVLFREGETPLGTTQPWDI